MSDIDDTNKKSYDYTSHYDLNKYFNKWIKQTEEDIIENILDYCDKPITKGKHRGLICCQVNNNCTNTNHYSSNDNTICKFCNLNMNSWSDKYHHELFDCKKKDVIKEEKVRLYLHRILDKKINKQFQLYKKILSSNTNNLLNKRNIPAPVRYLVWSEYANTDLMISKCFVCRTADITFHNFACGHIISEASGGDISIDNLRPICTNCNSSMKDMNMDEYIEKYKLWGSDPINLNKKHYQNN